jgi:hypothetical protein
MDSQGNVVRSVREDDPDEKPVQALDAGDIALLKSYVRASMFFIATMPCCGLSQ